MKSQPPPTRIYLRAWATRDSGDFKQRRTRSSLPIENVLVLDTETTIDPTQKLLFGSARTYQLRRIDGSLTHRLRKEWLFCADDLADTDPKGHKTLKAYAERHKLELLSRSQFNDRVIFRAAYKGRYTVVGFNLPFDLARLAQGSGPSRNTKGRDFSLRIWGYRNARGWWRDHPWRPRINVGKLGPGRARIHFTRPARTPDLEDAIPEGSPDGLPDPGYTFPGHFLDLHTLAFALTSKRHNLASACKTFGAAVTKGQAKHGRITASYIDYNRRDVEATAGLLTKLLEEYERHPISLPPTKAFSSATVGKAYLHTMGVKPPLEKWTDFPQEVLGYAMTAYYGGRAETRIRHLPVPVVTVDFLSMYPTVNSLMGMWTLLVADRLEVVDATEQIRGLLNQVAADGSDRLFDPHIWRGLVGLGLIQPDGDILPVRANYGTSREARPQIGLNPFSTDEPLWYAIPDLAASALTTGRPPTLIRAVRMDPTGPQAGLRPTRFRGEIPIDPTTRDFFKTVIEERKHAARRTDLTEREREWFNTGLKTLANATSYGVFTEMTQKLGEQAEVRIYGLDRPFDIEVSNPEDPGVFCFPPVGACIASGARLMLALLERLVTDRQGSYAFCDTDAMAIVATRNGGLIPCPGGPHRAENGDEAVLAVTWAEVDHIRQRFDNLHPYDREIVPEPILQLEAANTNPKTDKRRQVWCFATSAKRYVLWEQRGQEIHILKASEHGLGHLLNPTDPDSESTGWIEQAWRLVLSEQLSIETEEPEWLDRPAVSRLVATTPHLLDYFESYNNGKEYPNRIKPYNFLLTAQAQRVAGALLGADRLHLVGPYETDPRQWNQIPWFDIYTGRQFRLGTEVDPSDPDLIPVKSFRNAIEEWAYNPEPKSISPDGQPCGRHTVGLLSRRPIRASSQLVSYIGKESNRLDEGRSGLLDVTDALNHYPDPERDPWHNLVLPAIECVGAAEIARLSGLNRRTVDRLKSGSAATPATKEKVVAALRAVAGGALATIESELVRYLETQQRRVCEDCGSSLESRARNTRFCNDRCRIRLSRRSRPKSDPVVPAVREQPEN